MTISAEEIKGFVQESKKKRSDWLNIAERSWNEIKKRSSNGKVWLAPTSSDKRMAGKYPAWYSIYKIRQPIVLSRIGEPIGKDTSLSGSGLVSQTAATIIERLAKNMAKSFDFLEVMFDCRDDALATNFGQCRAFYESEEQKEKQEIRLTEVLDEKTQAPFYINSETGQPYRGKVEKDENGFYAETETVVAVKNEKICLEHVLYKDFLPDPKVNRWRKNKRLAYYLSYSPSEFRQVFGAEAYATLSQARDEREVGTTDEIKVIEYWDYFTKKTYWVAEESVELLTPLSLKKVEGEKVEDEGKGLYGLHNFFPSPKPIIFNQPTDEFWPVPEYFQIMEVLNDIHNIFNKMIQATRGIRIVLLFDDSVTGLKGALNESANGTTFGIPNLAQALTGSEGSLAVAAQYLDIMPIINAIAALQVQLENRLNIVYKLTGTSDLLQGLITDTANRTLGERQMTEKYALNQIAEAQKKVAEFVRDSYQLLVEMGLNNFEDVTLFKYIDVASLSPDMQAAVPAALDLLKDDPERFKIELETDSTTSINEEYDKKMRIELANVLTQALEKTANIAQTNPALIVVELKVLKYLVQSFRQGKLFQEEITKAIDQVIAASQEAKPQEFDKAAADAQFKQLKLQIDQQIANSNQQLKQYEVQANERLEYAKLEQAERIAQLEAQLAMMQAQSGIATEENDRQLEAQKLNAEIIAAREELALKQTQMMIELQKVTDKKEYDQLKLAMEAQARASETRLKEAEQKLEAFKIQSEEQEKWATERRLSAEHELTKIATQADIVTKLKSLTEPKTEKPKAKKLV